MSEEYSHQGNEKTERDLNDLVSRIQQAAQQSQYKGSIPLKIRFGREKVFEALPGEEPAKNTITSAQIELLQKAFSDPQGIQGSIKVPLGGEEIFKVKNGQVLIDQLGLAPTQNVTQTLNALKEETDVLEGRMGSLEADSQRFEDDLHTIKSNAQEFDDKLHQLQNDFSDLDQAVGEVETRIDPLEEKVTHTQNTLATLEQQVNGFQQKLEQQQQQFQDLSGQLERINETLERMNRSQVQVASETVGQFLRHLHSQVQAAGQQAQAQTLTRMQHTQARLGDYAQRLGIWTQTLSAHASQTVQSQTRQKIGQVSETIQRQAHQVSQIARSQAEQIAQKATQVAAQAQPVVQKAQATAQTIEQATAQIVQQTRQVVQRAQSKAVDRTQALGEAMRMKVGETTVAVTAAIAHRTASLVGEPGNDGSFLVTGKKQQLEINSAQITIVQRPTVNPEQLWEQYSQGTNPERPIQRTQETIQKALDDNRSRQEVKAMLTADPQLNAIAQQQGSAKAQQYAQQMIRSALNQRQTPQINGYQVKKAIDQDRSLE
ncbi:MAG: hypothetical protein GVY17_09675 [Cyanobacteria bacterium]|jgi:archaellum component FlaC/uncharacterized small protein (DUF1192 family)|nr:hypothetical protein [Cyanobacteria bacterium GSL.Bin21]